MKNFMGVPLGKKTIINIQEKFKGLISEFLKLNWIILNLYK